MHAYQAAVSRGAPQGFENTAIVEHEHARICHEQLEAGYALPDQRVHFVELGVGKIANDAMKSIVTYSFARCFFDPGVKSGSQGLAFVLNGKVDQSRGTTESRCARAGFEIFRTGRAAKRHVQMGMNVNTTRKNISFAGVNNAPCVLLGKLADRSNLAVTDGDIRDKSVNRCGDAPVRDNCVKGH